MQRGGLGQHAVGDQGRGGQAAQGEAEAGGAHGVGAGRAGFGDQAYGGAAVGEDGLHGGQLGVPAGGGLVEPVGGHRDAGEAAEDGAQGAGRLPLGREQAAQVAAELLGEGEQAECLGGGRQVHDQQLVPLAEGGVAQGAEEGELLGAGEGVSSSASRLEAPRRSRTFAARLWKAVRSSRKRAAASGRQAVRVGVRRVGSAPVAAPRTVPRVSVRSALRTRVGVPSAAARRAVAAATVVRPLPPGPVIRMVRMRVNRN